MTEKTREIRDYAIIAATAICEDLAANAGTADDCVKALRRFAGRLEGAPRLSRLDLAFERKVISNALTEKIQH